MHHIPIPNTDLSPSAICLGTGNIGSGLDRAASFHLLDLFVEHGGNFLDSAKVYADWLPGERSISEKTIGRWLCERGNRDQMVIATKGAHPELSSMHIPRVSAQEIVSDLDASLKNLQTDRLDIYWLHRDDESRPVSEIMDTLISQAEAGKIRSFGCSNWRTPRIKEGQDYASRRGAVGFVGNQMMWSLATVDRSAMPDQTMVVMDAEMKRFHAETGLAAIPYSSQANGLFQKMEKGAGGPASGMYAIEENKHRFDRLTQLKAQTGLSISELVLAYLLSQPFPTIPVIGARNCEQLLDTLKASDVRLTPEQVKYLESSL